MDRESIPIIGEKENENENELIGHSYFNTLVSCLVCAWFFDLFTHRR